MNAELALQGDTRPLALMLSNQATMKQFELACGRQAGEVMVNIINAANSSPDIWECEPRTVITAALNAATMHLSLSPSLGQACILPFNKGTKTATGWSNEKRAQLIVMLRGVKDLAMRTNKYRVLNAFTVYQGQTWTENQMTGLGSIEGSKTSDEPIGYGAYLLLFSGYEATVYMTVDEVRAHAQRYSPTFDKSKNSFNPKSKWVTDFDDQAKKTVLKRLIMNKGVINEGDRAALELAEAEHVEHEEIQPDEITDGHAEDMPTEPAPLTAEEIAYNDACMVKTPGGKIVNELDNAKFKACLAENYKDTEAGKAARIIDAWRKAKASKSDAKISTIESELGF